MSRRKMSRSLLQALDDHMVAHALSYLGDFDDLLAVAATCAAAEVLVRAHWAQIKPRADVCRTAFVRSLTNVHPLSHRQRVMQELEERPPRALPQATADAWQRPLSLVGRQRYVLPVGYGAVVESLKIGGLAGRSPGISVEVGGQTVVRIPAGFAQRLLSMGGEDDDDEEDAIELMQLLRYLVHPTLQDVALLVLCSDDAAVAGADAWVRMTTRDFDFSLGRHVVLPDNYYQWHVNSFEVEFDGCHRRRVRDNVLQLRGPLHLPVEYITLHFTAAAPRVTQFTLVIDGRPAASIPGWACRVRARGGGGFFYRIPVERQLDFSMVDCSRINVEFAQTVVAHDLEVIVGAMNCNIMRCCGNMFSAGLAFDY